MLGDNIADIQNLASVTGNKINIFQQFIIKAVSKDKDYKKTENSTESNDPQNSAKLNDNENQQNNENKKGKRTYVYRSSDRKLKVTAKDMYIQDSGVTSKWPCPYNAHAQDKYSDHINDKGAVYSENHKPHSNSPHSNSPHSQHGNHSHTPHSNHSHTKAKHSNAAPHSNHANNAAIQVSVNNNTEFVNFSFGKLGRYSPSSSFDVYSKSMYSDAYASKQNKYNGIFVVVNMKDTNTSSRWVKAKAYLKDSIGTQLASADVYWSSTATSAGSLISKADGTQKKGYTFFSKDSFSSNVTIGATVNIVVTEYTDSTAKKVSGISTTRTTISGTDMTKLTVNIDTQGPTGSVTINNGATETQTPNVTLKISASDTNGIDKIYISNVNNNTSGGTGWINYKTTSNWTLDNTTPGNKTVYVWFKDKLGNIKQAQSSILYKKAIQVSDFTDRITGANNWMTDEEAARLNKYWNNDEVVCKFKISPDSNKYRVKFEANIDDKGELDTDYIKIVKIERGGVVTDGGGSPIAEANNSHVLTFDVDNPGNKEIIVYCKYRFKNKVQPLTKLQFTSRVTITPYVGGVIKNSEAVSKTNVIKLRNATVDCM